MRQVLRLALMGVVVALSSFAAPAMAANYVETPSLEQRVSDGELPPVAERVPFVPRVVDLAATGREVGRNGGLIRTLMAGQKDIRMMTVYSYARFVCFNEKLDLVPDILESYDVEDGRIFTFHLRPGHKWSDGQPFTSEDIRFAWEDVINNESLSGAPPRAMLVNGEPPEFEVIDETTVRFTWKAPNPDFLSALAAPQPIFLNMPAHYLKQFHKKYQDPAKLEKLVEAQNLRNWKKLFARMSRQYRPENPELPTLDPWINTTEPPSDQFVFERNPYFHRVDTAGHQLPYVDTVRMSIGSSGLIPAKTGSGDSDLQGRYLRFDNYTFLKQGEKHAGYNVLLWQSGQGSNVALLPNLNVEDPVLREVFQDVRFRRALSLAINRHEVNEIVYFGLARESADTVLPQSPLYRSEYQHAWTDFDPDAANKLLDDMGLKRGPITGVRRWPDGRKAEIIVETSGESTLETDVLELVRDYFRDIGILLYVRASQRDVMRSRAFSGQAEMTVWGGLDNGVAAADMAPVELAPTAQSQLQWPRWGLYGETLGEKGEKPTLEPVVELSRLAKAWRQTTNAAERTRIWHEMLGLYTNQVFSIGIINGALQPIVVNDKLHNVPEKGIWSFSPTSYFGIYEPDTFWFDSN